MEIEPDGQQFLNARTAEDAKSNVAGGPDDPPRPPPPAPPGGGGSRTTVVVVAVVVAVLVVGGVAFATLTGDTEGRRELETGGASDLDIRDRAESTTTTEAPRETTTLPPDTTTIAPTHDSVAPFPDLGTQPGAPPAGPGDGGVTCPSGGIGTQVSSTSSSDLGERVELVVEGVVTNNTTTAVIPELTVSITHNGNGQPNPWVQPVRLASPSIGPGESATWTFTGTITGADPSLAGVSAIGGGFRWADPALLSCPTQ